MAGLVDIGSQKVLFDFKNPAESGEFNQFLKEIMQPGVYYGGASTINVGNNQVEIAPMKLALNCAVDKVVAIRTDATVFYSPSGGWPINETIHIYCNYIWSDSIENWMVFNSRLSSTAITTDEVIIATVTTNASGVLQTINTTNRGLGLNKAYVGELANLTTTDKTSLVNAINDLQAQINSLHP